MPMVVESIFELEFARIAAVMTDFYKNEDIVLFCCWIYVYSTTFYINCFSMSLFSMPLSTHVHAVRLCSRLLDY